MPRYRPCPKAPAFWDVVRLEKSLMELAVSDTSFPVSRLKAMGIERAPPLDIDDPNAADAHPVFFLPLADTPDFRNAVEMSIGEGREWSHCPDELAHFDRVSCAGHAIGWLDGTHNGAVIVHDLYPHDAPKWHRAYCGPPHKLPQYSASDEYLRKHGERPPRPLPQWFTRMAFYLDDKGMPHTGCWIADNTSHRTKPDEALRSEITAGVSFIRKYIQVSHDMQSTIPVIIFSFYHNETVRITQMCWEGEKNPIILRQSRLIDIVSDTLRTPEIFLLLRWMQCIPLRVPKVSPLPVATGAHTAKSTLPPPTTPARKGTLELSTKENNTTPTVVAHAANTPTPTKQTGTQQQKTPGSHPNTKGPNTNTQTQTSTTPPKQKLPRAGSERRPNNNNTTPPRSVTPTSGGTKPPSTGGSPPKQSTTTTSSSPLKPSTGGSPPRQTNTTTTNTTTNSPLKPATATISPAKQATTGAGHASGNTTPRKPAAAPAAPAAPPGASSNHTVVNLPKRGANVGTTTTGSHAHQPPQHGVHR